MVSSLVPAVPWTSRVESPEMAAARCSETQVLAVPGTPSRSRARSVARVATAISMRRRLPMYLGVIYEAVVERAAEEVGGDGPGGHLPVGGPLACVGLYELVEFFGEFLFGVGAEDGGGCWGGCGHWGSLDCGFISGSR